MSDFINNEAYVLFDTVQNKFVRNAMKSDQTHTSSLHEALMFSNEGIAMEYRNLFHSSVFGLNADKWIIIAIGPITR